jgi:hypothetical protein
MKKILYFVLLIAELFVDSVLMISLYDSSLYIPLAFSVAAVVGLLIWQLVRYVKVAELAVKRKLWRNIALILLIPIAVFFVTYVVIAITFIIAFA